MADTFGLPEIENRFGFHKATIEGENATLPKHTEIRIEFREMAAFLDKVLPPGRAKNVAFTELENASMWAHKAVAEEAPLIQEDRASLLHSEMVRSAAHVPSYSGGNPDVRDATLKQGLRPEYLE